MDTKSSWTSSKCSCKSAQNDLTEIETIMKGVICNLNKINKDLHMCVLKSCGDNAERSCKLKIALVHLISNDNILQELLDSLNDDHPIKDDLTTNFGISLKVDLACQKLDSAKEQHARLRTEWYSQDSHLNRLALKVEGKDEELEKQSIFCTTQGLVLSSMVWKASQTDELLDFIVSHQAQTLEVVKILDGCLYAFTQTYKAEMPEPTAEEYQYVVCLCGILSNLGAVPDGRCLLGSHEVSREIFNQIIKILPNILVPNAEGLKWIMLSAIYNIMICKDGEILIKNNTEVIKNVSACTMVPHTERIIILGLKIISKLTSEIPDQAYLQHVSASLPIKHLKSLQHAKDSITIRKQVKTIISSVTRMCQYYTNLNKEELLASTSLDKCTPKCPTMKNKKHSIMAYYVFTDTTKSSESDESSSSSSYSKTGPSSNTTTDNVTTYSSSSEEIMRTNQKIKPKLWPEREMPSLNLEQTTNQEVLKAMSAIDQPTTSLDYSQSHLIPSVSPSEANLLNPTTVPSLEIQTIQFQNSQPNQNNTFTVTIGDNLGVIALPNINNTAIITEQCCNEFGNNTRASIVTVYRAHNSVDLLSSSNSINAFVNNTIPASNSFPTNVTSVIGSTALARTENASSVVTFITEPDHSSSSINKTNI